MESIFQEVGNAARSNAAENLRGPTVRLLRLRDVLELVPISKSGWFAGINAGRFPKGRHLSPRVTVWRSDEIALLIAALGEPSLSNPSSPAVALPCRRYRDGKEV